MLPVLVKKGIQQSCSKDILNLDVKIKIYFHKSSHKYVVSVACTWCSQSITEYIYILTTQTISLKTALKKNSVRLCVFVFVWAGDKRSQRSV